MADFQTQMRERIDKVLEHPATRHPVYWAWSTLGASTGVFTAHTMAAFRDPMPPVHTPPSPTVTDRLLQGAELLAQPGAVLGDVAGIATAAAMTSFMNSERDEGIEAELQLMDRGEHAAQTHYRGDEALAAGAAVAVPFLAATAIERTAGDGVQNVLAIPALAVISLGALRIANRLGRGHGRKFGTPVAPPTAGPAGPGR